MNTISNTQINAAKKLTLNKETIRLLNTAQVGNQGYVQTQRCVTTDWCTYSGCATSYNCDLTV
jgi:hypothetical protein